MYCDYYPIGLGHRLVLTIDGMTEHRHSIQSNDHGYYLLSALCLLI